MRVCLGMLKCMCEHMLPSGMAKCTRVSGIVHMCIRQGTCVSLQYTLQGQLNTFMHVTFQALLTSIISMITHLTDSNGIN